MDFIWDVLSFGYFPSLKLSNLILGMFDDNININVQGDIDYQG